MKDFTRHLVRDFRHLHFSHPLIALFSNEIIQQIAGALVGAYYAVFLFTQFNYSVLKVALYFLVNYFVGIFLTPLGGFLMTRLGLKKSLMISVLFGTIYLYLIGSIQVGSPIWYLAVVLLFLNLDRMFYWIQYHTELAHFTSKHNRGKQISVLSAITALVAVFLPILGGQIITQYGFFILFVVCLTIYAFSVIPLLFLPDNREIYSYGYWETFQKLFSRQYRSLFVSKAADGMQHIIGVAFWPIFVWLILDKNYIAVGLVTSMVLVFNVITTLFVGDLIDQIPKKKVLGWGTWLYALGWVVKMFVGSSLQIFAASSYHDLAGQVMRTSYETLIYEKAASSGHLVDEYSVLKEVAINVGRCIMILLVIILYYFTESLGASFFLAALASLLINFIK